MWPCEGNGSSASPGSNSNIVSNSSAVPQDQTTPTWADRVRGGVARGSVGNSPLGSSRPSPSGNGETNKPQFAASANGTVRERNSSSLDRPNDSEAVTCASGVDHVLQTDSQSLEKREQDSLCELKVEGRGGEGEGEEGGGWETVNNSRNQSRNNSATTNVRREGGATQSVISAGNLDSSNDEEHVNEDTCKDDHPLSSSPSETSPQHEATHEESSASPPSQADFLTSRSDDLSLTNTDDSEQGLSIEDLASGAAAKLLLANDGEEEEEEKGMELRDKSTDLGGACTLSQGLSQASDKVR